MSSTSNSSHASPDLDDIVEKLRERVAARKSSGEYPTDLDSQLARLAQARRSLVGNPALDAALARVEQAQEFGRHRIGSESRHRLGSFFHRLVGRVVVRQTDGVFQQMRSYADAVEAALITVGETIGRRETLDAVSHRVDLILERLAVYERSPGDARQVRALSHRVKELDSQMAKAHFEPWYAQEDFEAAFRGDRGQILQSLRSLARHFAGCAPVLDFGCGRGEMLELLREMGVEAHGVELDTALVDHVHSLDLSAEVGDGTDYLRGSLDGSLGGIYLGQVIEHLTTQQALDVVALASIKLRAGGRLVVETVNNHSLYVFARSFYVDPTHVRPVPPDYLLFLVRQAGFSAWQIDWRSPVSAQETLEEVPATEALDADTTRLINRNIRRINDLLFGPQDYALVATR